MEALRSIRQDGEEFVTVFDPDLESPLIATDQHPRWDEIVEALYGEDAEDVTLTEIEDLFDLSKAVARVFRNLTERVSVANGRVYFDGDEVHEAITGHLVRALEDADEDTAYSLAAFMENVAANPSDHSREQLYEWLDRRDFTITPEGEVIAYKGVTSDLKSIRHGKAIVNGEAVNGAVPNDPGNIVEYPRSEVVADSAIGCAQGLHVGDWDYAEGWARGAVLEVIVNPRDVVSVPTDCNAAKVRVSRYRVVRAIDAPHTIPVLRAEEPEDDDPAEEWELRLVLSDGPLEELTVSGRNPWVPDGPVTEAELREAIEGSGTIASYVAVGEDTGREIALYNEHGERYFAEQARRVVTDPELYEWEFRTPGFLGQRGQWITMGPGYEIEARSPEEAKAEVLDRLDGEPQYRQRVRPAESGDGSWLEFGPDR